MSNGTPEQNEGVSRHIINILKHMHVHIWKQPKNSVGGHRNCLWLIIQMTQQEMNNLQYTS